MRVENFFQMNDWEIGKFIKVVFAIHLVLGGLIGLSLLGVDTPILRQVTGFLYLTFIPGLTLLRVFRIHKIGNIETILFSAGLSLVIQMITGLTINTFLPGIGITDPLSTINITISISLVCLALCIIAYYRDSHSSSPEYLDTREFFTPSCLFLCSLPFLTVIGTFLVNYYNSNLLLLFIISIMAITLVLTSFEKLIPSRYFPLAVLALAVSLLLHNGLISNYIFGWDVNQEYYWANKVLINSYWTFSDLNVVNGMIDWTDASAVNGMLSVVMLAPIYTMICGIDLTWTIKLIYPLLFALLPLALYRIFQRQTGDMIAFIACFFFISLFTFYTEMLALCRQQIAELFLALIILLFIKKEMNTKKRSFLIIAFAFSMVASHYALSYIYLAIFAASWALLAITETGQAKTIMDRLISVLKFEKRKVDLNRTITMTFLFIFVALAFSWYIYISSLNFYSIINIGDRVSTSITSEFLDPEAVQGLNLISSTNTATLLHSLSKYVHLSTQALIAIGVLASLTFKRMRLTREYTAFSIMNLGICIASITIPYFSSSMNTQRVYHIALIVLAPYAVIGGITIIELLAKCATTIVKTVHINNLTPQKIIAIFFAIFLLFNIQFLYVVTGDYSTSLSISQEYIKSTNNTKNIASFYQNHNTDTQVYSARWLGNHQAENAVIYAETPQIASTLTSNNKTNDKARDIFELFFIDAFNINSYLYMGTFNSKYNLVDSIDVQWSVEYISPVLDNSSIIYNNTGSKVYLIKY